MTITVLGALLIPISIYFVIFNPSRLLPLTVFSAGFFKAKVLMVSGIATGISPYLLFGGLLAARQLSQLSIDRIFNGRLSTSYWIGLLFLLACITSVFMAAIYSGKILVAPINVTYLDYQVEPLKFTKQNITQLFYPIAQFVVFLAIANSINDISKLVSALKASYWSFYAIFLSGIFYQSCLATGNFALVSQIFKLFTGAPELRMLDFQFGVPRMYSLAGEPGYSATFFICCMGFTLLISKLAENKIFLQGIGFYRYSFHLAVIACILTGGTSGFVGLLVFLPVAFLMQKRKPKNIKPKKQIVSLVGIFTLLAILNQTNFIANASELLSYHITKITVSSDKGSGKIRAKTAMEGIRVFAESPLLGAGYGSHRTTALSTSLLSNTGIIGTVLFLLFVFSILIPNFTLDGNANVISRKLALYLTAAYISYLCTCMIGTSIVALIFPWTWTLLAILAANTKLSKTELYENNLQHNA